MISLLDKIRSSISEEDSRLILGNRFRDKYLNAIHDFDLCYRRTGKSLFLRKHLNSPKNPKSQDYLPRLGNLMPSSSISPPIQPNLKSHCKIK